MNWWRTVSGMQNRDRLHRSELAVPASNLRMLEKAPDAGADIVFLDLEDAVAPDDKVQARLNAIEALQSQDWSKTATSVRINGLDTHWAYRDVVDIVEAVGNRIDMILVPKVGRPADLEFVELLLSQIEQAYGYDPIPLTALIETAPGMANVEAIAQACPDRLEALVFGVGDYAASTRARTTVIGGVTPEYAVLTEADAEGRRDLHWGDPWHFALSRVLVACRANGLRPIDGPFGDFSDTEGYRMSCRRAAALGYDGKWAIHPSQIAIANEVFSPMPEEVDRARRIISAMAEAAAEGRGAVSLDGRLIDAASIKMAENVVARAEMIAGA